MIELEPTVRVPLTQWEDGSIRFAGSRVTLDSVIAAYQRGETPAEIHEGFRSIPIEAIYGAIAYYLTHKQAVDSYLHERDEEGERIRQLIESDPATVAARARLRERINAHRASRIESESAEHALAAATGRIEDAMRRAGVSVENLIIGAATAVRVEIVRKEFGEW